MAKDTFYFSHDYNSRQDEKIKRLIRTHGMQGYGIFWSIVEDLYNNANALRTDYKGIAYDLHSDEQTIRSIINDFDLFVFEEDKFGSLSIQKRLDERNYKSKKARESALYRWSNANALQTHCEGNAIKERKGKARREKERNLLYPALNEVIEYSPTHGDSEQLAAKAFNYYSVADWKDGKGKQVKNWKQKMQSVWFKPENKITKTFDPSILVR